MAKSYEFVEKKKRNTAFSVILLCTAIILFGVFCFLLRTSPPLEAQPVRITEEILTVQMNPSVLKEALKERAADWCTVEHSLFGLGDITISSTDNGVTMYDRVFLTDSMAPVMAREYPHLFQYQEKDNCHSFTMSASRTSVSVPVWLVKSLIDLRILELPKDQPDDRRCQP